MKSPTKERASNFDIFSLGNKRRRMGGIETMPREVLNRALPDCLASPEGVVTASWVYS